jgi:formylglycine-generating enzyme required for sulfatase activity
MILIPAGPFGMGSKESGTERPEHEVWVDAFWIDRYPVTNAQWAAFLEGGGWDRRELWTKAGWEWREENSPQPDHWDAHRHKRDHPVRGVCWYESLAYARWAGKALLSEAQWEKATRGDDGRRYPWGDKFDPDRCNTSASGVGDTTPVSRYSPAGDSPYGVADVAGNVWEWCCNLCAPYPYEAADGRERPEGARSRVMRGGSFRSEFSARSTYRLADGPYFRDWTCGVRVGLVATGGLPRSRR